MATFTGTAGSGAGALPGHEPKVVATLLSRSASQFVVRYQVGSNAINLRNTSGNFSGTLKVNNSSYAVTGYVNTGGGIFWTRDITYKTAAATTLAISLTGSVANTQGWTSTSLSGSMNVPAGVSAPDPIDDLVLQSRSSDTSNSLVMAWGAVTGATAYKMRYQRDGGTWGDSTGGTIVGTTYEITMSYPDSYYRYNVRAVNAGGQSAASNYIDVYTTPFQPPTPSLAADGSGTKVSVAQGNNKYLFGLEIERNADGTAYAGSRLASGTGVGGTVTSVTDTRTTSPLTQWRARRFLGPEGQPHRVYGPWSDWSPSQMAATYSPPKITSMSARRCDSAGVLTETGRYLRVTTSGTVSKVPNANNQETNTLTRRIGYRKKGTEPWTETTVVNNGAPNNWANSGVTIGSNLIAETEVWEVQATVQDAYTGAVIQQVTVPVSQVALSLGPAGIGAGKTWEQGALDVGGDAYVSGDLILSGDEKVWVGGQPYQKTGVVEVSLASFTSQGGLYRSMNNPITLPYTPPSGYAFTFEPVYLPTTNNLGGNVWVTRLNDSDRESGATLTCYATASGAAAAPAEIRWTLVKIQ